MKVNEVPEKIYIPRLISDGKLIHEWNAVPFRKFRLFYDREVAENIEYTRTDAFIEKARKWFEKQNEWRDLNGIKHCDMENFEDFRNYMKGE